MYYKHLRKSRSRETSPSGVKNAGGTIHPISGRVFVNLKKAQIQAIQFVKRVPVDKLEMAVKNAGISNENIKFTQDFIKKTLRWLLVIL